jgi:polyhydroxyalkanoate synthesis regulator phasin
MQMMSQGQMTPEAMKQMHEKMGQMCAMMAQGKGCPMMQEFKKQLDDLNKRVEALEGKGKAKQK